MKVGELARKTGLSVRTLHYYHELGLLEPERRASSGHRHYGARELERLQQIQSLRALGLTLEEVRACLARPDTTLPRILELHLDRLRQQVALQQRLVERLERMLAGERDYLATLELMSMLDKYYTPEQREQLSLRYDETARAAEAEWPELIARVQRHLEAATDPAHPEVQALARRWSELVELFTAGDPGLQASLEKLYREEPRVAEQQGLSPELMGYVRRAQAIRSQAETP